MDQYWFDVVRTKKPDHYTYDALDSDLKTKKFVGGKQVSDEVIKKIGF